MELSLAQSIEGRLLGREINSKVSEGEGEGSHADEEASASVIGVLVKHVVERAVREERVSLGRKGREETTRPRQSTTHSQRFQ